VQSNHANANKNHENLSWYRQFSEKWRKALLSVFETLKYDYIDMFYFVQENLTVLFERRKSDSSIRAYLQLNSLALAEDFKINGKILFHPIFCNF
jgi:hypothetical protein